MSDHHRSADQWEVCIHGEETLGTSLHNMSAPTRGSKRSDATRKARAQAAPFAKKKRRLNAPGDRVGGAERARPNRNRQQYQNDHRDSKNRHHKVEGSMKRDRQ